MRASRHVAAVVSVTVTVLSLAQAVGPTAMVAHAAPVSSAERCVDRRVLLAAKAAAAKLRCHAKAFRSGAPVDTACLDRAHARMLRGLDRLAARACPEEARTTFGALLGQSTDDIVDDAMGEVIGLPGVVAAAILAAFAILTILIAVFTLLTRIDRMRQKIALLGGDEQRSVRLVERATEFRDEVTDIVGGSTTTSTTTSTSSTTSSTVTTTTTTSTTTTTIGLVEFVAAPLAGPAPLTVTFTNLSTGSFTSWHWDFGDGATSNAPQPVHHYLLPGVYTVSLSGDGGPPVVKLQYVQVF